LGDFNWLALSLKYNPLKDQGFQLSLAVAPPAGSKSLQKEPFVKSRPCLGPISQGFEAMLALSARGRNVKSGSIALTMGRRPTQSSTEVVAQLAHD
jgi:hypothetical protein